MSFVIRLNCWEGGGQCFIKTELRVIGDGAGVLGGGCWLLGAVVLGCAKTSGYI